MIRDAILSITVIDDQMPSHHAFSCGTREIFFVEDKDSIRSSGAPTESESCRFPEQVGARFLWPGQVSGPDRVRALPGLLK